MYYCDKKLGALEPITGVLDFGAAIANIFGQSEAAKAQEKALSQQAKMQKELIAAQQQMSQQQAITEQSNTTLYIVGGILAAAVVGIVLMSRGK